MKRFLSFLARRVEVHYRASDLHLSVVGTLVIDTGESIVLEDRFVQAGKYKMMRVAIPYDYVVRIAVSNDQPIEQPRPKTPPVA